MSRRPRSCLLLLALCAPACEARPPAAPAATIEARWTKSLAPATREDLEHRLAEPWGYSIDVYRSAPDGETSVAVMNDCASYFELSARGFEARPLYDQLAVGADCRALRAVAEAAPSRTSHLRGFRLDQDSVEVLPPDLSLVISDEDADRVEAASADGKSWLELEPIDTVTSEGEAAILVEGEGWAVRVEVLAWGDFDGDGLEDVLVKLTGWLSEGSYRTTRLLALTRRQAGARLDPVSEYDLS